MIGLKRRDLSRLFVKMDIEKEIREDKKLTPRKFYEEGGKKKYN